MGKRRLAREKGFTGQSPIYYFISRAPVADIYIYIVYEQKGSTGPDSKRKIKVESLFRLLRDWVTQHRTSMNPVAYVEMCISWNVAKISSKVVGTLMVQYNVIWAVDFINGS